MDNTSLATFTVSGPGGGINVAGRAVDLTNGSKLITAAFGDGDAGSIRLSATDHIGLIGTTPSDTNAQGFITPTGLFTNSWGDIGLGNLGAAGSIEVSTPHLTMAFGGRINTVTKSSGSGGNVIINADTVSISGEFNVADYLIEGTIVDIGNFRPSGIFTRTIGEGETCSGVCGNGGNVVMNVGSLTMGPGSQIDSGTSSTGRGGNIVVNGANSIFLSGTLRDGSPVGILSRSLGDTPDAGAGGDISLTAGQSLTIHNGASASASSTGPGNTGNIEINAGNQFTLSNSSITTEATQSGGGIIKITTDPSGTVELSNSKISASVLDGTGGGGSVNIDPQFVILQNSQILAEAVQGPGGNISITITNGGLFLPDATSRVSASSQFGQSGTVTIQSPNAPAGGKIQPLGKAPLQVTALLSQRCAAIARGEVSSFVVAGRDTLPTEPGGWLPSPLAFGSPEAGAVVQAGNPENSSESIDPAILSLRRLPSPSKIAPLLAEDWVTDCTS